MSVYAFLRRSFCCKKKGKKTVVQQENEWVELLMKACKCNLVTETDVWKLRVLMEARARAMCLILLRDRWNHLSGVWKRGGGRERARGEGTRGEGAGVYGPRWLRDPQAPRLCSALIIFWRWGQKKKGGIGRKARDLSVVTGPPTSPPLVGVVWTQKRWGKSGGGVDSRLGFPATAAGLSQNSLSLFEGPVLLRFQVSTVC